MPGSLVSNHIHIIFSTKNRIDTIPGDLAEQIYNLMISVISAHHSTVRAIGGTTNHVHILLSLNQESRLSYVVGDIKVATSRWIHEHGRAFEWQTGYGAFSVGQRELALVTNYIREQNEHHKRFTYDEELVKILRHAQIEFGPDHVFG